VAHGRRARGRAGGDPPEALGDAEETFDQQRDQCPDAEPLARRQGLGQPMDIGGETLGWGGGEWGVGHGGLLVYFSSVGK
jgi:hypothetical protein